MKEQISLSNMLHKKIKILVLNISNQNFKLFNKKLISQKPQKQALKPFEKKKDKTMDKNSNKKI
jgi:hypothetical protein